MLFGRKKKKQPPPTRSTGVGLYGKHPGAGDFIRVNASGPEVALLDEWLSAGLDRARRVLPDFDDAYGSLFSASFLLGFPGEARAGSTLLGVMVPSRDEIGRQFPLIIFAHIDPVLATDNFDSIPHEPFIGHATRLLQRRNTMSRDELLSAIKGLKPPDAASLGQAKTEQQSYLEQTPWLAAFNTMLGLSAMMQTGKAVGLIHQVTRSMKGGKPVPRYGLRCPLGQQAPGNAGFWLALLRGGLDRSLLPSLVWSPSHLLLFPGVCSSKALPALLSATWEDDGICDLATWDEDPGEVILPSPDQPLNKLL